MLCRRKIMRLPCREIFVIVLVVRLPPGFVKVVTNNKASEEVTVRVLPNCTGKVGCSETGERIKCLFIVSICAPHSGFKINQKISFASYCHAPALFLVCCSHPNDDGSGDRKGINK